MRATAANQEPSSTVDPTSASKLAEAEARIAALTEQNASLIAKVSQMASDMNELAFKNQLMLEMVQDGLCIFAQLRITLRVTAVGSRTTGGRAHRKRT